MIAFDANVLVYAVDNRDPTRHAVAQHAVAAALSDGRALLPLQTLAEFQNVVVRKLQIEPRKALAFVDIWSAAARVEAYQLDDLRSAAETQARHGLPLWDALIWAVCQRVGAEFLVSEDFQDGRRLGRVTFLSPFEPKNLARLGLA